MSKLFKYSHYDWLEQNFETFLRNLGEEHPEWYSVEFSSHGDKFYQYKDTWDKVGIPFEHGVAIGHLTHLKPWTNEVRDTDNGWVKVVDWVVNNYQRFKPYLPAAYQRIEKT